MRKLPALAAVRHALHSVVTYRDIGMRIGIAWVTALALLEVTALGLVGFDPQFRNSPDGMARTWFVDGLSAAIGLVAFASIAVNWHRFILRDEAPASPLQLRIDHVVWRYLGNTILIVMSAVMPVVLLTAILLSISPAAAMFAIPVALFAGVALMRASVKLPGVALDRRDFGIREAFASTEGNALPILAILLINVAVAYGAIYAVMLIVQALSVVDPMLALSAGVVLGAAVNLFYTLFSVSVLTSLYGFFAERRDF